MNFDDLLHDPGEWLNSAPTAHPVVISSRVRLARNLVNHPFPGWAKKAERIEVLHRIKPALLSLPALEHSFGSDMNELSPVQKQILVERHLISVEHAGKGVGSAVAINAPATISIMVNEEDHLRMQALRPGFDLDSAFDAISLVDDQLDAQLEFAFDSDIGFLTACPTNVGTGMRASAMLHLPGLVLADQINQIIQSVNKIGLAVRGIHGEGTEALGNLFQISNQTTLGESEYDILRRLKEIIHTVIKHEHNARRKLVSEKLATLRDQVGRAYGILCHSWSISSKEALNLLSLIKLGLDLGAFPKEFRREVDALMTTSQPAHLQKLTDEKLAADERDRLRAFIIREKLKSFPSPDTSSFGEEQAASA